MNRSIKKNDPMNSPTPLPTGMRLDVRHLSTFFDTDEGLIRSVADVSFSIRPGKTTALVGESGSGKSVTSLTLMRLLSRTASTQVSGEAMFTNRAGQVLDLLSLPEADMRRIRGNEIAMIFQEPMTSLNPVFTVGEQIAESVRLHMGLDRKAALSFLGVGVPPEIPTWGTMVAGSQQYAHQALWIVLFPGLAIILTALSLQLLGDGIRDLLDPRLRKSM